MGMENSEVGISSGVLLEQRLMNKNKPTASRQPTESATTYQKQAYDFVKARIMNLDLKPGQYITDSQIAAELNISRTPVRDALRLLEHEGFLISEARRGWKVYSLSLKDIHEIFEIKAVLESLIVRQAAACDDGEKRTALGDLMERMKQAATAKDYESWRQADIELHDTIFSMCPNERASQIVRSLDEQWFRIRFAFVAIQGRMERSNPEHEAIVKSILAGDGEGAERSMRTHINNMRQELAHLLTDLVLPFAQEGV
jgi:DNA-binding GntR family transcriptional regulator